MKFNSYIEYLRKYSFYIGLIGLTVVLVIIFRHKRLDDLVAEGKKGLASLYIRDMKPMIYTNEITNEDVFNFAMFNSLPINKKENKFLYVSQDSLGKSAISFHNSEYKGNTDNYEKFVQFLELTSGGKKQFDSLLTYYKAKLYSAIWSDEKNTLAVNQNIPLIHDLICMDIKHFADKMNPGKSRELYAVRGDVLNPIEIKKVEASLFNDSKPQDYLLVDQDSVYQINISTDIPKLVITSNGSETNWRDELKKSRMWPNENSVNNIEKEKELLEKYTPSRSHNEVRVNVPNVPGHKDIERELSKLKSLTKLGQMFSFEVDAKDGKKRPISFKMNFDPSKIDSFVNSTMKMALQFVPPEEREKVKKEIDSAMVKEKLMRRINEQKMNRNLPIKDKPRKPKNADTTGNR